jgi:hypothetical protein
MVLCKNHVVLIHIFCHIKIANHPLMCINDYKEILGKQLLG